MINYSLILQATKKNLTWGKKLKIKTGKKSENQNQKPKNFGV